MKVRMGFVSNSSSSSFVLCKAHMTKEQIKAMSKWVDKYDEGEWGDGSPQESVGHFFGAVSYHAELEKFLDTIGVKKEAIDMGD